MKTNLYYVIYSIIDEKVNIEKIFTTNQVKKFDICRYIAGLEKLYKEIYPKSKIKFDYDIACNHKIPNNYKY